MRGLLFALQVLDAHAERAGQFRVQPDIADPLPLSIWVWRVTVMAAKEVELAAATQRSFSSPSENAPTRVIIGAWKLTMP
jgi:hypothetical protein